MLLPLFAVGAYLLWQSASARASDDPGRKVLYYQDSMHPWVKSDHPGKCTVCGMDLTPIYEGQFGLGANPNLGPDTESIGSLDLSKAATMAMIVSPTSNLLRRSSFSALNLRP